MKFLARIEKQKIAWILIGVCLVFSILRLPSLIEPYWYGDEGVYEVIGQSMNQGRLLYRDIWDNKPPLLYVIYALANGDQPTIKTFSLIIGILTIIAFYFLSQKLFNKQKISVGITLLFILLFGTPILEANIANAENFILLPIILGALIIYSISSKLKPQTTNYKLLTTKILMLAGLLLGVAFLLKIVAIFDLAAFLYFMFVLKLPEKIPFPFFTNKIRHTPGVMSYKLWIKTFIPNSLFIILGFLIPLLITIIYFAFNHALYDFFQAAFTGNVGYVGYKNTLFGIPQGGLIIKALLLVCGMVLVFKNRKNLTTPAIFILLWLMFDLFNVYFSGRPYTHYAIVLIPSFCLFIGLLFTAKSSVNKAKIFAVILIVISLLYYQFRFNINHSFRYYQNVIQFLSSQKSVQDYQTFFDQNVPRDYAVANFITTHTTAKDTIFVWGNNPEIYALSHKMPIGKYTVAYHIQQNNAFDETQQEINKKEPKYIIVLKESQPLPFVIPLYIMRYNITGATIYERSL